MYSNRKSGESKGMGKEAVDGGQWALDSEYGVDVSGFYAMAIVIARMCNCYEVNE